MGTLTKSNRLIIVLALVCCLFSSCKLFTDAGQRLGIYCPGLNLKLNGVSWSGSGPVDVYILGYDSGYQQKVSAYFADKTQGFAVANPRSYPDIKDGDDRAIARGDSILSKTITKGNKTGTVVYNVTTQKIIIIETTNK